jgi:primary-amine oxidase
MRCIVKAILPIVAVLGLLSPFSAAQARTGSFSCPSGQTIQSTLSSGASWSMCWEARDQEGVVLSDIRYQAPGQTQRRVLGEMSLSQIQRNYDDGAGPEFLVTATGLGGSNFINLDSDECAGGQLRYSAGKAVLCQTQQDSGFIYKFSTNNAVSGKALSLVTASQLGSYSYTVQWLFHENGSIEPRVGLSGHINRTGADTAFGWPIQQDGTTGVSFVDNYFWRMDFDLGSDASNDVVEQITSSLSADRSRRSKSISTIATEAARDFSPEVKRFWRIRDGSETNGVSAISYELVLLNYDHQSTGSNGESWLQNDVFFTRYRACERFAADNDTTSGCGWGVESYTTGENINQSDVVAWNRISYHHLPRDEDDNVIGMRWSGFKLLPRDWHSQNPL